MTSGTIEPSTHGPCHSDERRFHRSKRSYHYPALGAFYRNADAKKEEGPVALPPASLSRGPLALPGPAFTRRQVRCGAQGFSRSRSAVACGGEGTDGARDGEPLNAVVLQVPDVGNQYLGLLKAPRGRSHARSGARALSAGRPYQIEPDESGHVLWAEHSLGSTALVQMGK